MIKVLDTAAGDIVEISLPAIGPYGIVLAADSDGYIYNIYYMLYIRLRDSEPRGGEVSQQCILASSKEIELYKKLQNL